MQLFSILIIHYPGSSAAVQRSQSSAVISVNGDSITAQLTDFLSASQIPRGMGINLILDQAFVRYQHFDFPKTSARRLRQMIPFELEDTLLKGSENYLFGYGSISDKQQEITRVGVYIVEKGLLDELISVFKLFGLELRCLTSLENLQDIAYQETPHKPENEIRIDLDENNASARLFIYHNGFLTGISALSGYQAASGTPLSLNNENFAKQLNQVITAIRLSNPDLGRISVSGAFGKRLSFNNDQFVPGSSHSGSMGGVSVVETPPIKLDHAKRINLIRSQLLFAQEIKTHFRSLVTIAGILLFCVTLYVGMITYRAYLDRVALQTLERRLTETISRSLPANTSQSNAIYVLKERIENLETEKKRKAVFEQRRYLVVKTLTDLSLSKEQVPSLILDRFALNDQAIHFQGKTSSLADFDRLQDRILKLFQVSEFRIHTNQKSLADGSIDFSTTVQEKPANR